MQPFPTEKQKVFLPFPKKQQNVEHPAVEERQNVPQGEESTLPLS
jgi:hypothetical protein